MFIGHQKNWDKLLGLVHQKKLPPVLIFYGPEGIGKSLVARHLAAFLFCCDKNQQNNEKSLGLFGPLSKEQKTFPKSACGKCGSCLKVFGRQHADFYWIEPEGNSLKIEAIRKLQSDLARTPLEGNIKVVVMDQAHTLTLQAANALLKTLEEAPAHVYFVLISPGLSQLIPTIRSRAQKLYFETLSYDECRQVLKTHEEISSERLDSLIRLSDGSPGLILKFVSEEILQGFESINAVLETPAVLFSAITEAVENILSLKGDLDLTLEMVKKHLMEKMKGDKNWEYVEKVDKVSNAQKDLDRNVNKSLILENLLIQLR
ncbi:MAG: hypothetical protein A2048_05185 [Deltaproteobacteria bacterium GWA2_45_12]|nr:MAG: hypothetical protein A2048_05185 [Deltaproteobacteria bacterium GWA2_45_12]